MANEAEYTYASPVTVSSHSGTVIVGGLSGSASIVAALSSANHSNYPLGDAVLSFSGTNTISSGSNIINLFRRDINISGTNDSPILDTATNLLYLQKYVGSFVAPAASASFTAAKYLSLTGIPLSNECEFYIENKLNIPIGGSWVLTITPKTFVPGS